MDEEQKIEGSFIIEILGKPKEHVKESIEKLVSSMNEEKGTSVLEKTIHNPKKLEQKEEDKEQDEMFTTFAEIDVEFDKMENLLNFVFKFMPSNIEINKPENFVLKNDYIGEILTGITLRLHKYDEVAKKLYQDNAILQKRLNSIASKIKEAQENKKKESEKNED